MKTKDTLFIISLLFIDSYWMKKTNMNKIFLPATFPLQPHVPKGEGKTFSKTYFFQFYFKKVFRSRNFKVLKYFTVKVRLKRCSVGRIRRSAARIGGGEGGGWGVGEGWGTELPLDGTLRRFGPLPPPRLRCGSKGVKSLFLLRHRRSVASCFCTAPVRQLCHHRVDDVFQDGQAVFFTQHLLQPCVVAQVDKLLGSQRTKPNVWQERFQGVFERVGSCHLQ